MKLKEFFIEEWKDQGGRERVPFWLWLTLSLPIYVLKAIFIAPFKKE